MTEIKNLILENEAVNQMNLDLEAENKELKTELEFLRKQNRALKMRCSDYCLRNQKLEDEIADLKFTRNFLGVQMTPEDLAIEASENGYKPYNGDDF